VGAKLKSRNANTLQKLDNNLKVRKQNVACSAQCPFIACCLTESMQFIVQ
jgi:hypothetical protein